MVSHLSLSDLNWHISESVWLDLILLTFQGSFRPRLSLHMHFPARDSRITEVSQSFPKHPLPAGLQVSMQGSVLREGTGRLSKFREWDISVSAAVQQFWSLSPSCRDGRGDLRLLLRVDLTSAL